MCVCSNSRRENASDRVCAVSVVCRHGDDTGDKRWGERTRYHAQYSFTLSRLTYTHTLGFVLCAGELRLKVVTIATDETDGYKRFLRSTQMFGIDVEVGELPSDPAVCDV